MFRRSTFAGAVTAYKPLRGSLRALAALGFRSRRTPAASSRMNITRSVKPVPQIVEAEPELQPSPKLHFKPIGLREANAFVIAWHRHHGPVRGHKFSISVVDDEGCVRGVVIAGRPLARELDDGAHLEVLRVCTDGTPNACSMLYGAVRRAAKAMGYQPQDIITYTLEDESGASLRGAGWRYDALTRGGTWHRPSRARRDSHPTVRKVRWVAT